MLGSLRSIRLFQPRFEYRGMILGDDSRPRVRASPHATNGRGQADRPGSLWDSSRPCRVSVFTGDFPAGLESLSAKTIIGAQYGDPEESRGEPSFPTILAGSVSVGSRKLGDSVILEI